MKNNHSKTSPLMPVEEGIHHILSNVTPVSKSEICPLKKLSGRILARDMMSPLNVPPNDNSAMDGYALHSADLDKPDLTLFPVAGRIQAGDDIGVIEPGTVKRIFTGAAIPNGTGAVVMQENTSAFERPETEREKNTGQEKIIINKMPAKNANIRNAGEDIQVDQTILPTGRRLRPSDIGLIASIGRESAEVFTNIKVAFFSTGDELCEPGMPLKAGNIYNSNRFMLHALLDSHHCETLDLGQIPDNFEQTVQTLSKAAQQADLIISTGGVSVGEEDHVKKALESIGKLDLWRLRMKPGKPLVFGHIGASYFLGLPGNPVSTFATFMIFAKPLINKLQGSQETQFSGIQVRMGFEIPKPRTRREFVRVKLKNTYEGSFIHLLPHQGSGVLSSVSQADGLAIIQEERVYNKNDLVEYLPFNGLYQA